MKKLLLTCATVGLAVGAGYLLYRTWKCYYGERKDSNESNEAVRKKTIFKFVVKLLGYQALVAS